MTTSSQKSVSYFDPTKQCRVTKDIQIPPPIKMQDLGGLSVQEIRSMDDLKSLWCNNITADLSVPLDSHSRTVLKEEIQKAFPDKADKDAIADLCSTWLPNDDRAVKILGRLLSDARELRAWKDLSMASHTQLVHENGLLREKAKHLEAEVRALTGDVTSLVKQRDEAMRGSSATPAEREGFVRKIGELEGVLSRTLHEKVQAEADRDAARRESDGLRRSAKRDVESAVTEYESAVMAKLGDVASAHKVAVAENKELKAENSRLRNQLTPVCASTREKEVAVTGEKMAEEDRLKEGDEVYCKVSDEGPFVLVSRVDEAHIEYANPITDKKHKSFYVGKLPVLNVWLVRCKDASFRTLPEATLTKTAPRSNLSMSFSGVRSVVTSDVTARLFQAAIWASMIVLLYMQRGH